MAHGLITRIEDNFMIVMTDQMTIDKLKVRPHVKVGQRIEFTKKDIYRGFLLFNYKKASSMLALILVLILTSIVAFGQNGSREIYTVVSVDINPSIELNLDQSGIVVGYKSFNEAGQEILSRSLLNQDLDDALSQIILLAQDKQYLVGRDMILISSTVLKMSDAKLDSTQETTIEEQIESYMIANNAKYQFVYIEGIDRAENSKPTRSLGRETLYTYAKDSADIDLSPVEALVGDALLSSSSDMNEENSVKILLHDDSATYNILTRTKPLIAYVRPSAHDFLASTQRSMAFETGTQDYLKPNNDALSLEEIKDIKRLTPQASIIAYENTNTDVEPNDEKIPTKGNSTSLNASNQAILSQEKEKEKEEEKEQEQAPDILDNNLDEKIENLGTESEINGPQSTPSSDKSSLPAHVSDETLIPRPESNEVPQPTPESDKAQILIPETNKPSSPPPPTDETSKPSPPTNEPAKPAPPTVETSKPTPNPNSNK